MTSDQPRILIVGGYGVVGAQIARILARRSPQARLLIAGRSLEKARQLAATLPGSEGGRIDVGDADPLASLAMKIDMVVAAVNDPANALMKAAIRRGIAYLDITRWTERLTPAVLEAAALAPVAPAVFASSWMASVPGMIAIHLAADIAEVERIDLSILYALKDNAGPNSVEYADHLAEPFMAFEAGAWKAVRPFTGPKDIRFPGGGVHRAHRFATPDLVTLPAATGARSVAVRLAYDDAATVGLLGLLVRSGVWKAISGSAFEQFRRSLLFNPGPGAPHEVVVEIEGRDTSAAAQHIVATIRDPHGQTHLTALGAVLQVEAALGLDGRTPRTPGVHLGETLQDVDGAIAFLRAEGVEIVVTRGPQDRQASSR
ncbi:MAG: saccharopine dehydrogenase [Alphaproteobacteria bacterium]|nr:MAG: saccharopine dehydrogenase [Caulobacteraceae bacterium]TPW05303.1 MAG: saccharopine dehydrogenase [Alphaproteobacteria bacterium]